CGDAVALFHAQVQIGFLLDYGLVGNGFAPVGFHLPADKKGNAVSIVVQRLGLRGGQLGGNVLRARQNTVAHLRPTILELLAFIGISGGGHEFGHGVVEAVGHHVDAKDIGEELGLTLLVTSPALGCLQNCLGDDAVLRGVDGNAAVGEAPVQSMGDEDELVRGGVVIDPVIVPVHRVAVGVGGK